MQYSTVFSTADAPKLNAIYYYYFLPAKDPMNLDTAAFGLQSYLAQYTGASYLVAVSSLGYEEYYEQGVAYDTEHVIMLDNTGYMWDFWIYPTEEGFSAFIDLYPTDLVEYGLTFPGNGEDMYCSLVGVDYDNAYVSVYTGDTNELYHLAWDYSTTEGGFAASYLGSFGADVWPAAITSVTSNDASGSDSVNTVRGKNAMHIDSVKVSAEELAAVKIAPKAESKTPIAVQPMAGSAVVADKEEYVTVTITAGAAEAAPATLSEELFTNGVTTVNWDTNALELVEIAMGADYTSINQGEGTATLGYVQLDGYAADDVVATLYFKVKNTDTESVTVIYEEINNDKLGIEETVAINYPHANTEVRDAKEATCTEEGYTGDTYCTDCGEKISEGESIPKVDPENPKTSETRAFLMATAAVMVAAAAAVVVMISRKKLF
jgi:hypothetical protein